MFKSLPKFPKVLPLNCSCFNVQMWALGCVNSPPAAGGSQEEGFTQPRAHSFAQPCNARKEVGFDNFFVAYNLKS